MGRDATFYCRTCKTSIDLGYGSYGTWLDGCCTVEEFDAQVARDASLGTLAKNVRMRQALVDHAGHDFETHSGDWTYRQGGVLYTETGPMGEGQPRIDLTDWTHESEDTP